MPEMNAFERWLIQYELTDPEPWPMREVQNQYTHEISTRLFAVRGSLSYHPEDVMKHIEWSQRMTQTWMVAKNKFDRIVILA
jgi:hypothetical protein